MDDGSPMGAAGAGEAGAAPPGRAAALRVYVPQLVEITPLDGGRFLSRCVDTGQADQQAEG